MVRRAPRARQHGDDDERSLPCPSSRPMTERRSSTRTGGAAARPSLLSHGWPLNSDAWEAAALFLAERGHRVIAHDRRGHGRSGQSWDGNEMDTYADDLACLIAHLDLTELTLVGHSTGGGEIVRYLGRHGSSRVAKLVLVSAVPPLMLQHRRQPGRPADRGVRRHPRGRGRQPLAAVPRPRRRPVLRQQPHRRRAAGHARCVLAAGTRLGDAQRVRVHRGVLGHRLPRGPRRHRRADPGDPRRRRPDRAVRDQRATLGGARSPTRGCSSTRAAPTAFPTRRASACTPTSSRSSTRDPSHPATTHRTNRKELR